jgi:hypothetical protein
MRQTHLEHAGTEVSFEYRFDERRDGGGGMTCRGAIRREPIALLHGLPIWKCVCLLATLTTPESVAMSGTLNLGPSILFA